MKHKESKISLIFVYLYLSITAFLSLFPFYWIAVGSTQPSQNVYLNPPSLFFGNQFITNFINLNQSRDILRVFWNTSFVSISYTFFTLFVCSMAGFAFAKYDFKGKKIIFGSFMISMMIPFYATVIPLFLLMVKMDLLNTYRAIILPTLASPFGIFLFKQNLESFPSELLEAGRIDGANEFRMFFQLVLPNIPTVISAATIFLFMSQWNNFLWPLIVTNLPHMFTFPVALAGLQGVSVTDYGQIFTGLVLATLPIMIVFLILQKRFIAGMMNGAIK